MHTLESPRASKSISSNLEIKYQGAVFLTSFALTSAVHPAQTLLIVLKNLLQQRGCQGDELWVIGQQQLNAQMGMWLMPNDSFIQQSIQSGNCSQSAEAACCCTAGSLEAYNELLVNFC
jgi:hypothetical protein